MVNFASFIFNINSLGDFLLMIKRNFLYVLLILVFLVSPLVLASNNIDSKRFIVKIADDGQLDEHIKNNVVDEVNEPIKYSRKQVASASVGISGTKKIVVENVEGKVLKNERLVVYAEPDYIVRALGDETPWNLKSLGIDFSQIDGYGEGVRIAILDTGSNNKYILEGYDFVNEDHNTSDDNGHGTLVSQILKSSDSELPLIDTEIYSVKVLNSQGVGYVSDVIEGVNWAIDNNIDIVLMSFGGNGNSVFLE